MNFLGHIEDPTVWGLCLLSLLFETRRITGSYVQQLRCARLRAASTPGLSQLQLTRLLTKHQDNKKRLVVVLGLSRIASLAKLHHQQAPETLNHYS